MRILFTKHQPLDAPGGETSHLFALANSMRAMGIEVFLMPVTGHATPAGLWPAEYIREIRPFGLHHTLDSFSISSAVAAFIKEMPVDAILSWQYETAYLPEFVGPHRFMHGVIAAAPFGLLKQKADSDPLRAFVYHFFHFRMLRKADVIYCASQFARDELVNRIGLASDKITVIPIGVDETFQSLPTPKTGPLRKFIFSGFLEPIKGIFDALEALTIVQQRGYKDWTLKIAGWGGEAAVRKFSRERGLEEHIQFIGALGRPALAAEMAGADLAIMPSHIETFGLSIAEAQACGLPVVSYRIGSIPEVVRDGSTAILVDPLSPSQLADAILRLINDPEEARAMGARGQKYIRENFSWKKAAELMIESIQNHQRSISGVPLVKRP